MAAEQEHDPDQVPSLKRDEGWAHKWLGWTLLVIMAGEWVLLLLDGRWLSMFLVTLIIAALFAPILFRKNLAVDIPVEFHFTAVIFMTASLYLGEVQSFYERFWWWDITLHATAGLLMGIAGFLLVYLLNESSRVELHMTPGFISLFAFSFAVTIGTLWEIFEFAMDQLAGMNMQKPMLGDYSGLTDTMWDIIVNAIGAFIITFTGWRYLNRKEIFFIKKWIRAFIHKNPSWFHR
ncbi:MAG: hypothetical protein RI601_04825 [Desulfurivibrionaceae bacterium]|nr:hypothetical protein [Desulfurivibrionaceae bacterium]